MRKLRGLVSKITGQQHKESSIEPTYQPVNSAKLEVRLLHVDTSSTDPEGRIKCQLKRVSIRRFVFPVFYEAISWCWGDPTPVKEILLNGVPRKISMNAEEVIRRLCFKQGHAIVWLDAICIDQSNIQERGEQVAIMKDVYSRAYRTLIWLGEDHDASTQAALESIEKLLVQCRKETNNFRNLQGTIWSPRGLELHSNRQLPDCDWKALNKFFSASFFTRLWIIQEIILSKEVRCIRGQYSKPFADISLVAQWLYYCNYWREAHMGHNVDGIFNTALIWRQTYVKSQIANWLVTSIEFHASLPLDKIYGLLGLMQNNLKGVLDFTPDYTAQVDIVYTAATRLAIDKLTGTADQLFILQHAQRLFPPGGEKSVECNQTPSWVPRYDWKYDIWRSPQQIELFGDGAANGMPASIREHDPQDPRLLSVKGILISHVIWRSGLLAAAIFYSGMHGDVYTLAKELLSCRSAAHEHGHPDAAIAMAMTGRRNSMSDDASEDLDFVETYRNCIRWCEAVTRGEQEHDPSSDHIPADVFTYLDALWHGTRNRFFFTTASGQIGIGPPDMEPTDAVCILFGSTIPLVLREEKNGRWRLLGAPYLHGIMEVSNHLWNSCGFTCGPKKLTLEYRASTSDSSKTRVVWKRRRGGLTLNDERISIQLQQSQTEAPTPSSPFVSSLRGNKRP